MEVLSGWGMDTDSRLYFRKNYAKYEFFKKPLVSSWWNNSDGLISLILHSVSHMLQSLIWFLCIAIIVWHYFRRLRVLTAVVFILVGFFPGSHGLYIQWNQRDDESLSAHTGITLSICPWVLGGDLELKFCLCIFVGSIIHCTHPSMANYFSTQRRPF